MKTLYLVRHAKSSWDYPDLDDFERPLNKRGMRDAPKMGKRLKERDILPDLLLSSPATRAINTAREIAYQIDYPEENIETDEEIYHAGKDILLRVLRAQNDSINSIMLFGHNPGFTNFANAIANQDIDNVPTAGIVAIEFKNAGWGNLDFGDGKLLFFDYPKKNKK